MRKYGLKLWSKDFVKNRDFAKDAEKALKDGLFDYLELFALPSTFEETKDAVKAAFLGQKVVIHAPHSVQHLNIADPQELEHNRLLIKDSQLFADLLCSDIIILHPGMEQGEAFLAESIRQFRAFNDVRLTVENLPAICSSTGHKLHGVTPLEIKRIMVETGVKFCLDFSHAICGANSCCADVYDVLNQFKALKPSMYHLCDGDVLSTIDSHLHYGEGNYDLKRLVTEFTTENALITMETGHGIPVDVKPWLEDISYLKTLVSA